MSTPIHQRNYSCEAFDEGDGRMTVRGHLTDTRSLGLCVADGEPLVIHDMTIELAVVVAGFEIVGVGAEMHTHPYRQCPGVLADYQQLVGVSIARGYSRRVRELFGGPNGCSHMGALLQAMGPVAVQASWSLVGLHDEPAARLELDADPAERTRRLRLNTDTCHVWAVGGDQLNAVEHGGRPSRPRWETERLRKLGVEVDDQD